jgi:hypothetical protein
MPIGPTPQLKAGLFGARGVAAQPGGGLKKPPPPTGPKGVRVEARAGIQTPAEVIWDLIYDTATWGDWNPFFVHAEGQVRLGGPLNIDLALPDGGTKRIDGTVLEWVPREQLHWRVSANRGLVRTIHYVEIDSVGDTGCIVSIGGIVGGLLGKTAVRQTAGFYKQGYQAMAEALKVRAEADWARQKA